MRSSYMLVDVFKRVKSKFLNKRKERLRKTINIEQDENNLTISGYLSNDKYQVEGLLFLNRENELDQLFIKNKKKSNEFLCTFQLSDFGKEVSEEKIYNAYLFVKVHESVFDQHDIKKIESNSKIIIDNQNRKYYLYPIRLGRFEDTQIDNIENIKMFNTEYMLYRTTKGNISISLNKALRQEIITQINRLYKYKDNLKINGKLFTRSHTIEAISLSIVGRDTNEAYYFPVSTNYLLEKTKKRFGLNRYHFETNISMSEMAVQKFLEEDIYDLFLDISFKNEDDYRGIRLGKPRFMARRKINHNSVINGNTAHFFNPYYRFRLRNLSIQINKFDKDSYRYLRKIMKWSWIINKINKRKDIWIIGERVHKAQDTGYHLFKYIRQTYPEKNVYYVIDENSEELANVKDLGNVLYYKSTEHIKATIAATRIIGSHHPDYLYPLRTDEFKNKVYGKKVFLQHGVMGTKNMVANYGKESPGFYTDMFMVSSDVEKEMIIDDFGYDREEVIVTGLSRFDKLFKDDVKVKRQLL